MSAIVAARNYVAWALRRASVQATEAQRNFYYRVRETSQGRTLLKAAEYLRAPSENRCMPSSVSGRRSSSGHSPPRSSAMACLMR